MLHFSRNDSEPDLYQPLYKIKELSTRIELKISQKEKDGIDSFIETLSVEELKDLRQVILASEYLLTKYRDKRDIRDFLADFVGIIMHAANSVNAMKDDLEDLVISAEVALKNIQELHYEITQETALGRGVQSRLDDYGHSQEFTPSDNLGCHDASLAKDPSPINLTIPARRVHTNDYLERTEVEI